MKENYRYYKIIHNCGVDFLKVGHHGSRTSSAPEFIHKIKPQIALISAGRHNRYGHPHQATLDILQNNHVAYFNTAKAGMITYQYNYFGQAQWNTYRK